MSIEHSATSPEEARKKAEEILRFKIGPQYSLGETETEGSEYVFPILISPPRVIFNETRSTPVDVKYLEPTQVGEIRVNKNEEVDYTLPQTVYRRVRDYEEEIQQAVEKALISAAAKDFTKLPFPENRYAPVEDILSEVILRDEIQLEKIAYLDSPDEEEQGKYTRYVQELENIDLLRREDGKVKAGNVLINIQRDTNKKSEALNAALAHYFKQNINNLEDIHQILGPYLAVAGFYYRLAIEADMLPTVEEKELRDAFEQHYKGRGKQTDVKVFKFSRYLLHLERAGILELITKPNGRVWSGTEAIKKDLEDQTQYLGVISNPA